jgi:hypothetical protein
MSKPPFPLLWALIDKGILRTYLNLAPERRGLINRGAIIAGVSSSASSILADILKVLFESR